jgi:phage terminase large subunit-like protein
MTRRPSSTLSTPDSTSSSAPEPRTRTISVSSSSPAASPSTFRPPRWASPQLLIDGRLPPSYGNLVADWIETFLVHGEGDVLGKPVRLDPFQRYILTRKYEYDPHTGRLLHDQVVVGLPKGNSKTELFGQDADSRLVGRLAPASPNVIVSAAAWAQTKRLFNAARLALSEGPLRAIFGKGAIFDDRIELPGRPGVLSRIAAHAGTNDGGLESDHYGDEIHEWVTERQERVWTVIGNSLAKRMPVVTLPGGVEVRGHQQNGITTAGSSMDSLAGRLYAKGVRVARGEEVDPRFLFLWWEADEHWDIGTEEGLLGAILQANPAAGSFLAIENLLDRYGDIERHEFERYHLNRWVAAPDTWISYEAWLGAAHPSIDLPPDGTEVWLGFDGSKSRDSTSIMGCTADRHIFEVRSWDRDVRDPDWRVPRLEVDEALEDAFRRWKVRRLACDPPRWERELEEWAQRFGDELVLAFDTNVYERFAPAVGRFENDFRAGRLTNDGSEAVARHIGNARTKETRWGFVITKEHKDSPRRIDRAVAAVLAHDGISAPPAPPVDRTLRTWGS